MHGTLRTHIIIFADVIQSFRAAGEGHGRWGVTGRSLTRGVRVSKL